MINGKVIKLICQKEKLTSELKSEVLILKPEKKRLMEKYEKQSKKLTVLQDQSKIVGLKLIKKKKKRTC